MNCVDKLNETLQSSCDCVTFQGMSCILINKAYMTLVQILVLCVQIWWVILGVDAVQILHNLFASEDNVFIEGRAPCGLTC